MNPEPNHHQKDYLTLGFFKEIFHKLEVNQREVGSLIKEIHTDVVLLKEKQSRTDKVLNTLEQRFESVEEKVVNIQIRLKDLESDTETAQHNTTYWSELISTKLFDLMVSAFLLFGGFFLGQYVDKENNQPILTPDALEDLLENK